MVMASYSNGVTRAEAQVALANFRNPQGLLAVGGNNWVETFESGPPVWAPHRRQLWRAALGRAGRLQRGPDRRAGQHDDRPARLPGQRPDHQDARPGDVHPGEPEMRHPLCRCAPSPSLYALRATGGDAASACGAALARLRWPWAAPVACAAGRSAARSGH
jgi:hypothetical protein